MNEANLEYLKKSLDYLGFGTKLNEVVETAIRREIPKFSVGISSHFEPPLRLGLDWAQKDTVHFTLDFNKAKDSDTYFLNDYTAALKTHNGIERKQEFNLERDHRVTAVQAYRLLSGAAIQKEVAKRRDGENTPAEKQQVWLKLDLDIVDSYGKHPLAKTYPNYGFDILAAIDKYPIVWKNDSEKETLVNELKKGSLPEVSMDFGGRTSLVVVSANPKMKNLDVYDTKMNVVRNDRIFPGDAGAPQRVELTDKHQSSEQSVFATSPSHADENGQSENQTRTRTR